MENSVPPRCLNIIYIPKLGIYTNQICLKTMNKYVNKCIKNCNLLL